MTTPKKKPRTTRPTVFKVFKVWMHEQAADLLMEYGEVLVRRHRAFLGRKIRGTLTLSPQRKRRKT